MATNLHDVVAILRIDRTLRRKRMNSGIKDAEAYTTNIGNYEDRWASPASIALEELVDIEDSARQRVDHQFRVGESFAGQAPATLAESVRRGSSSHKIPDVMVQIRCALPFGGAGATTRLLVVTAMAELKRALSRTLTIDGYPTSEDAVRLLTEKLQLAMKQVEGQVALYVRTFERNYAPLKIRHHIALMATCGHWFVLGWFKEDGTALPNDLPDIPPDPEDEVTYDPALEIPGSTRREFARHVAHVPIIKQIVWGLTIYSMKEQKGWNKLQSMRPSFLESLQRFTTSPGTGDLDDCFIATWPQ
ncbi:hypothetical protein MIND_01027300 [Mycena indigotica]|uniref:Uncharacterized protein n=1 Tax=Mycena indigotica TaxID=2126181 RepID=A0A8H6W0I1_9AGAR|nr:uncharacterized protein MIND_01027300 [Mycena indigotica]KAF7294894.1 hypothetical protein MIND_01027300 [Mycena indigotica]